MSDCPIAIIDSGGANVASLQFALQRLDCTSVVTSDAKQIQSAPRVILPGVGAAKHSMQNLRDSKLIRVIRELQQPVLGICLGMQLLADSSAEENVECLGIIPGDVALLPGSPQCPAPNMGWCRITATAPHPVLDGLSDASYFYFVHSYALAISATTLASAEHARPFAAISAQDNFVGAQFHPERSSAPGSRFLKNFLSWTP